MTDNPVTGVIAETTINAMNPDPNLARTPLVHIVLRENPRGIPHLYPYRYLIDGTSSEGFI
jgi:hypothetical protein